MFKPKFKWAEKTAVITGAGSGIGTTAIAWAKKRATVHLANYGKERITKLLVVG